MYEELEKASKITLICYRLVRKRGGGVNPLASTKIFVKKKEKNAECSETEKYSKIFLDMFARVSVKNIF